MTDGMTDGAIKLAQERPICLHRNRGRTKGTPGKWCTQPAKWYVLDGVIRYTWCTKHVPLTSVSGQVPKRLLP